MVKEYEFRDYLQKMWNMVEDAQSRGNEKMLYLRVDNFCACRKMAESLTGKQFDVNADDVVYIVGES